MSFNRYEDALKSVMPYNFSTKYEIIIYWSDIDNSYIAEVPELPGCMADGKTYLEALQKAQVIISDWLETARSLGRGIPVPRGRLAYA
jgi:predicted RNase H-like HicB family nuclease